MKITQKQQEEIDWICKEFGEGYIPTEEEKQMYILNTVHGNHIEVESKGIALTGLSQVEEFKRRLDINIKMWRKDIADGLLMVSEFEEQMWGYGDKVFKSIMMNLPEKTPGEGFLRSSSILWANNRWGLTLKVSDDALYEYLEMKVPLVELTQPPKKPLYYRVLYRCIFLLKQFWNFLQD